MATLCYVTDGKRVLMLYRNKKENDIHKGKYNGLGGKIEPGETPYECVIREVKEESGLTIEKPVLKGILIFPEFDGENSWNVFVYLAERFKGKVKHSSEGELIWIDIKNILKLNLWDGDRYFIKYVFKKNVFFYGVFYYKKGRLIKYRMRCI